MYEYRFEPVDVRRDPQNYHHRIGELAAEGWRLVQVVVENPATVPTEVTLIVERSKP